MGQEPMESMFEGKATIHVSMKMEGIVQGLSQIV